MSSAEIKEGDLVQLKSGGPVLTVSSMVHGDLACEWFDQAGNFHRERMTYASLVKVEGEPAATEPSKPKVKRGAPKINRSGMVV